MNKNNSELGIGTSQCGLGVKSKLKLITKVFSLKRKLDKEHTKNRAAPTNEPLDYKINKNVLVENLYTNII